MSKKGNVIPLKEASKIRRRKRRKALLEMFYFRRGKLMARSHQTAMASLAVMAISASLSPSIFYLVGTGAVAIAALILLSYRQKIQVLEAIAWITVWCAIAVAIHNFVAPIQSWRMPLAIILSGIALAVLLSSLPQRKQHPKNQNQKRP